MRAFHSLSVVDQLYMLAEIAKQPYHRSHRERRACVALIFRLAAPHTPVQAAPAAPSLSPSHVEPASSSSRESPSSALQSSPAASPLAARTSPPPSSPPTQQEARLPFPPTGYSRYLSPTPSYSRLVSHLHSLTQLPFVRTSHLELLFIQRALNPHDRWSGQMALPGGRQQRGESDYITAVREVYEELGLSLWEEAQWLYVGRMDDRHIESFGGVKPLAVCPFIFLQRVEHTPRITMAVKEVHAVLFTPLSFFTDPQIRWDYLVHPLVRTWTSKWRGKRRVEVGYRVRKKATMAAAPAATSQLLRLLPSVASLPSVHFPALALPGVFETADGRHGVSLRDTLLYQHTPEQQRQRQHHHESSQPPPSIPSSPDGARPDDDEDDDDDDDQRGPSELSMDVDIEAGAFILWGFSLVLLSDLLLSSFQCSSLSSHIDKGQKDRQRMLRVLYRSIDLMDGVERRWKGLSRSTQQLFSQLTGRAVDHAEPDDAHGMDVSVHRDVAAAASSEEEIERRKAETERRQRAAPPTASKL